MTFSAARPTAEETRRFLEIIHPEGHFEIRCLNRVKGSPRNLSGIFDSHEAAAKAVASISTKFKGIYFTLNPTDRAATNCLAAASKTSADADILDRRWLLIDIEGARPDSKANASESEVSAACDLADTLRQTVTGASPLKLCSGNGCHLLYRIDLPNDDRARALIKQALTGLAARYSTEAATIDTTVFNASRISKLPGTMTRKGEHTEERPQRWAHVLDWGVTGILPTAQLEEWASWAPPERSQPESRGAEVKTATAQPDRVERARKWLEKRDPAVEGAHGDDWTYKTACAVLVDFDLTEQDALEVLRDWNSRCQPPWDDSTLAAFVAKAGKYATGTRGSKAVPPCGAQKVLLTGLTYEKAEQILDAVRAANEPLRVFIDKPTGRISDLRDSGVIYCESNESLAHLCEIRMGLRFFGLDKEGNEKATDVPEKPLKRILGMPAADTGLPAITELIDCPVLAEDGTMVLSTGLHPTGLYLRPGLALPEVPQAPTEEQVGKAVANIDYLINDFSLEGPEDRQAWYAWLLTPFIAGRAPRPWPLWNASAPGQGAGKGLLMSLPAWIAMGEAPGVIPIDSTDKDAEVRKKLTSLLDGAQKPSRWQILDNLKGHLSSGALEAFVTAQVWQDRVLNSNRMGSWPIKIALALTGNNLTLSPDLERRQILVRLLPDTDRPWERNDFTIPDLVGYVRQNRAHIVWSILVLIQRWVSLGFPQGARRLGSFEGWSAAIGGLLECVGIGAEFLASSRVPVKEDQWQMFIQSWADSHLEKRRQPASELVRFIEKAGIHLADGSPAVSLGKKLARQIGRVFRVETVQDSYLVRLTSSKSGNAIFWSLDKVQRNNPPNPPNPPSSHTNKAFCDSQSSANPPGYPPQPSGVGGLEDWVGGLQNGKRSAQSEIGGSEDSEGLFAEIKLEDFPL